MPFLQNKIKKFINLYYNFAIIFESDKGDANDTSRINKTTQNTLFSEARRFCQKIRCGIFYCKSLGTRQIKTEPCCDKKNAWLDYKVGEKNNG